MQCMMCENLSWEHICKNCQILFLTPSLYERTINNTTVYSFYKYSEIKNLLYKKHSDLGFYIYNILAKNSFKKFADNFSYPHKVNSIGVDEDSKDGYSHTAILNKSLKNNLITPLHGKLLATNKVKYSGKSKEYRLLHPRQFKLEAFEGDEVIIVDDIITTGYTLTQAIDTLKYKDKNILFCITLADVSLQ